MALPNLQRNQRNTQRRRDVDRVASAIIQYQKNNNGELPFRGGSLDTNFIPRYVDSNCRFEKKFGRDGSDDYYTTSAYGGYIYRECSDNFTDPDDTIYSITFFAGTWDDERNNTFGHKAAKEEFHNIEVALHSKCSDKEDSIRYSEGLRKFVVMMALEGGQIYCVDNN